MKSFRLYLLRVRQGNVCRWIILNVYYTVWQSRDAATTTASFQSTSHWSLRGRVENSISKFEFETGKILVEALTKRRREPVRSVDVIASTFWFDPQRDKKIKLQTKRLVFFASTVVSLWTKLHLVSNKLWAAWERWKKVTKRFETLRDAIRSCKFVPWQRVFVLQRWRYEEKWRKKKGENEGSIRRYWNGSNPYFARGQSSTRTLKYAERSQIPLLRKFLEVK